jgi:hypothetical protein
MPPQRTRSERAVAERKLLGFGDDDLDAGYTRSARVDDGSEGSPTRSPARVAARARL